MAKLFSTLSVDALMRKGEEECGRKGRREEGKRKGRREEGKRVRKGEEGR